MKSVAYEINYVEMRCYLNLYISYRWLVRNNIHLNLDFKNQLNKISQMKISKDYEIS